MKKEPRKSIVLFDMDGTLTPARKPIEFDVVQAVKQLTQHVEVGVVTGSGFDYLTEQCGLLWKAIGSCMPTDITLMPCNGTQVFIWEDQEWKVRHQVSMTKEISREKYRKLIARLCKFQASIVKDYDIPLTGEFLSYRGSLLNWCFIGRAADNDQRSEFVQINQATGLRQRYLGKIRKFCKKAGIDVVCALGGETSIDIYPRGWDKTYALKHYSDHDVFFVGDKCENNGNDETICLAAGENCYPTQGPKDTIRIIREVLLPKLEDHEKT